MGERPKGLVLDRIDNNGDYDPMNCRWVTPKESTINRENVKRIPFNGRNLLLSELAKEIGITRPGLRRRIGKFGIEKAIALGPSIRPYLANPSSKRSKYYAQT